MYLSIEPTRKWKRIESGKNFNLLPKSPSIWVVPPSGWQWVVAPPTHTHTHTQSHPIDFDNSQTERQTDTHVSVSVSLCIFLCANCWLTRLNFIALDERVNCRGWRGWSGGRGLCGWRFYIVRCHRQPPPPTNTTGSRKIAHESFGIGRTWKLPLKKKRKMAKRSKGVENAAANPTLHCHQYTRVWVRICVFISRSH